MLSFNVVYLFIVYLVSSISLLQNKNNVMIEKYKLCWLKFLISYYFLITFFCCFISVEEDFILHIVKRHTSYWWYIQSEWLQIRLLANFPNYRTNDFSRSFDKKAWTFLHDDLYTVMNRNSLSNILKRLNWATIIGTKKTYLLDLNIIKGLKSNICNGDLKLNIFWIFH